MAFGNLEYANTNGVADTYTVGLKVQDESGNLGVGSPITLTFTVNDPGAAAPVQNVAAGLTLDVSTNVTVWETNLRFTDWTQVFGDEQLTAALLDRLTHHAHILEFVGESYRFRERIQRDVQEHKCLAHQIENESS